MIEILTRQPICDPLTADDFYIIYDKRPSKFFLNKPERSIIALKMRAGDRADADKMFALTDAKIE